MKHRHLIPLLFFGCCALAACPGDPYSDYVGLWEGKTTASWNGKPRHHVMEISRQGDSYLLNHDALASNDGAMLLSKNGGQLLVGGAAGIPLAFGADTDTILYNRDTFRRITPERVARIRENIKREEAAGKAREAQCRDTLAALSAEYEAVNKDRGLDWAKRRIMQEAVKTKHRKRYEEQGCDMNAWPLI